MRCDACGALNPASAAWCGQCLVRFVQAEGPAASGPTEPVADSSSGTTPAPSTTNETYDAPRRSGAARDVRTVDGQVEWRCQRCDAWAALGRSSCPVCGAARTGFGDTVSGAGRTLPMATAVAGSALLPGAAHVAAGRVGSGLARVGLGVGWLAGGVALLRGSGGAGLARLPGLVLLLGAGVLWAVTLLDARTLTAAGGREVLSARALAVLVATVTGLLLVAMVVAGATG